MKHTRRFLSALLALAMLCMLTVPALAAAPEKDLDTPLWRIRGYDSYEDLINTYTEYSYMTVEEVEAYYAEDVAYILNFMETRPQETAQFRANVYDYYSEEYGEYGTPEAFMTYWNETEEEFVAEMTVWQILDCREVENYTAEWAALCAEQPERTARFLAELDTWFTEEYTWYDSFEEYCEYRSCIEEAYAELFAEWNWEYEWERVQEQARQEFITSHGGVVGQINVMVNGECVKFPDAVPELVNGRTMVPLRAVMNALGGKTSYDGETETITCVKGDTTLTLVIGSESMTVTKDGTTTSRKIGCAPYIKGDRTYVPVRFIGEALGYDVSWDSYRSAAVITDLDALAEKIDQDFAIVNKLLARNAPTGKAQRTVSSAQAGITMFDSINGDKTGTVSYSGDLTVSEAGISGKMKYDLSYLWDIYDSYTYTPAYSPVDDYYAQQLELVKALMKGEAEARVDLKKEMLYFSMPVLFEALNSAMEESGTQLPKNGWLSVSLKDRNLDELTGLMGSSATVGKALCAYYADRYIFDMDSYDEILDAAWHIAQFIGDAKFTRQGSANVLSLDRDGLFALFDGELDETDKQMFSKFALTLTVKDNGDLDLDLQCNVALANESINLGDMAQITVKATQRGGKYEATAELHIKNTCKMTVKTQSERTETDKAPEVSPPEGVLVLPVDGNLPV